MRYRPLLVPGPWWLGQRWLEPPPCLRPGYIGSVASAFVRNQALNKTKWREYEMVIHNKIVTTP